MTPNKDYPAKMKLIFKKTGKYSISIIHPAIGYLAVLMIMQQPFERVHL
jgi:hypothetical protein